MLRFLYILYMGTAQHRPDAQQHLADGERFGDVVVGPKVEARNLVVLRAFCCKENNRNVTGGLVAAQMFSYFKAIHSSHHNIKQDELIVGYIQRQRLLAGVGRVDLIAFGLQVVPEYLTEIFLVVNH